MAGQGDSVTDLSQEFLNDVFATFAEYIAVEGLKAVMEQAYIEAIRASVTGATREEVLAMAAEKAAELVTNVSDQMRQQLAEKIAYGLEAQLGPDGTARLLRDGLGLDAPRAERLQKYRDELAAEGLSQAEIDKKVEAYRDELISERAEVIAQNEMGKAIEGGAFENAKRGGATHKVWIPVFAGNVCEDCLANAEQGPIPIGDQFSTGDEFGQAHPGCHCTVSYITDTGAGEVERAEERARARAEKIRAEIEAAQAAESEGNA